MHLNKAYVLYRTNPTDENKEILGKAMYKFCTSFVKKKYCHERGHASYELLEDAIMKTCERVWKELAKYDMAKGRSFSSWVCLILDSDIIDAFRKYGKDKEEGVHDGMPDRTNAYARIEAKLTLRQMLATLSPEDQEFVRLKMEGYSDADIAKGYGHNIQWAKDRFRAIKRQMRSTCEPKA